MSCIGWLARSLVSEVLECPRKSPWSTEIAKHACYITPIHRSVPQTLLLSAWFAGLSLEQVCAHN